MSLQMGLAVHAWFGIGPGIIKSKNIGQQIGIQLGVCVAQVFRMAPRLLAADAWARG